MKIPATLIAMFAAAMPAMAQQDAEQRRQAEEARRAAEEARERNREPRFYKEPYRPGRIEGNPATSPSASLEEAAALEAAGRGPEAVRAYERAARSGSGKAALRLAEIYDKGIAGVAPDYPASLKWRNAARTFGEDVPLRR